MVCYPRLESHAVDLSRMADKRQSVVSHSRNLFCLKQDPKSYVEEGGGK